MKAKFVAFVQMSDGIRIEKESRADELRSKVRFTSLQTPILSLLTVLTMCSAFGIRAEKMQRNLACSLPVRLPPKISLSLNSLRRCSLFEVNGVQCAHSNGIHWSPERLFSTAGEKMVKGNRIRSSSLTRLGSKLSEKMVILSIHRQTNHYHTMLPQQLTYFLTALGDVGAGSSELCKSCINSTVHQPFSKQ